jgi:FkbM family methyltransferase
MSLRRIASSVTPRRVKHVIRAIFDASQGGEASLLKSLTRKFDCERFIVDVGANDGLTISNSLPFVKLGWRAILIEPAPAAYAKLAKNFSGQANVHCIQAACSDKTGEANFFLGTDAEDGLLGTLCQSDNDWFAVARSTKSVIVKTDTLTNILRSNGSPRQPGILLVDAEAMDYEVLLGLDFSEFRPTLICTEEYELEPHKHAAKYSLLIENGYGLVQKVGCNTIWVDRAAARSK